MRGVLSAGKIGNFSGVPRIQTLDNAVNEDAQLIELTLAGNSSAFETLVHRYQDRLYNTMVHIAGSAEEAHDVVQDAFVQAFVKLRSFQGTSAFYTWLYRIAFNAAVSRSRRQRPRLSVESTREATGDEPAARDAAPDERLEQQERIQQVQAALGMLSEEHRTILVLREMEGCDYETIGEMLDLPVGTVRSRLHRARMELRELLKEVVP